MARQYDPATWYWLRDDGAVYAGPQQVVVTTSDTGYAAFVAAGNSATPWPHDDAGAQTTAALQAVLSPCGMFVDLLAYAANKRWLKETGGITVSGVTILTDDRSKQMIMGARIAAAADGTFTTAWVSADGSVVTLNATQLIAISNAVLAHVANCFAVYATVKAGIDASTITGRAAIDSAFA